MIGYIANIIFFSLAYLVLGGLLAASYPITPGNVSDGVIVYAVAGLVLAFFGKRARGLVFFISVVALIGLIGLCWIAFS